MLWTSCTSALLILHGFIIVLPGVILAQELTSTLHVAESGEHYAYVGENVTFTCLIRESNSIAWSSDEYIGTDSLRIEFSSVESEGTTRTPSIDNGWTVAELSRTTSFVDGMVSKLHIIIQPVHVFRNSSITCHDVGNDLSNTTSFNVEKNTSLTCNKKDLCPGEQVTCTCTTAHSHTLAWIGEQFFEDRIAFIASDEVAMPEVKGNASAVLIHSSAKNGVRVLKANLTFNASEDDTNNITCVNSGEGITKTVPLPMADRCTTFPTKASATTITIEEDTNTTSSDIGPGGKDTIEWQYIVISFTVGGVILFVIVLIIWRCPPHKWIRKLCGSKESDAGGDDDKTGNGVTNKGPENEQRKPTEQCKPTTEDTNSGDQGKVVLEMEARLTKMFMSQMESQQEKRESAIQEIREEEQRKREELAKELRADYQKEIKETAEELRADHQKEIDEMDKRFEELKIENQEKLQRMFEHVEEVKREKQRQLKEMEEKLRTERQSEIDKLNTQIARLRDEIKKLEETCEQLMELDQKKQKKVEKLERELESTRRKLQSLRDSMNKRNDSGTELRRRKGHDEKYKKVFEKTYKDSTQFDTYSMSNFDVSSRIFEAIKKLRREQLEVLKEGLSKMNSLIEKELQDMPYDDVKVAMQ